MMEEESDAQEQFLQAFKELLELQNIRVSHPMELNFQYPLIVPTQIPNTFVVDLGPYYNQVEQPELLTQKQDQQQVKEEEHHSEPENENQWLPNITGNIAGNMAGNIAGNFAGQNNIKGKQQK